MKYSLTRYERETNIIMNDDDDLARIITYQRSIITKLRKNSAAHETVNPALESYGGAQFEIPAKLIRFGAPPSDAARIARAANAQKARTMARDVNNAQKD